MERVRIMVVEDESIIAKDIQMTLKNLGYEVPYTVPSGEQAIKKAEEDRPDLILMDIVLQGEMDGIEAASHIHSLFDIPIIYLTAYADEKTLDRAKVTEPFGYILKPFEERELHTNIEMALYKHTLGKKLKEATVQLIQSEKLAALGELTAGVAHELNQPLNCIKIISQSLLKDITRNELKEKDLEHELNDVVNQVNKMAEIIDHLRVFTRRSEGVPREKIDINSLLEGTFKFLRQQLKNHNIEVLEELCLDLPKVVGDPIRLEQVFLNLITNARNAVEKSGKEHMKIEVRTYIANTKGNSSVVMEVKDNAQGIPEHIKDKIFQPFFTTGAPGQGTGLGLSVSNTIIEEHQGRIELDNIVGEGSTFRVILPAIA